jgi:phosphoribosylaminoimidazole carboxylase (NCAIR synthetase)
MTQREELNADQKKINWLLGFEKETLADMAHQQSKIIERLQKATKAQTVPEWIPVSDRLPEEHSKPYQVAATCLKKYEGGNYDGQGKKTIVQDYVIRRWPQNFVSWFELPSSPEQNK